MTRGVQCLHHRSVLPMFLSLLPSPSPTEVQSNVLAVEMHSNISIEGLTKESPEYRISVSVVSFMYEVMLWHTEENGTPLPTQERIDSWLVIKSVYLSYLTPETLYTIDFPSL